MNGLAFSSETEAWAVGEHGAIFRYNGSHWALFANPTIYSLNAVTFTTRDDGWAVGDLAQIIHWNGSSWAIVQPYQPFGTGPNASELSLRDVEFSGPNIGWAVGAENNEGAGGPIAYLWDGETWKETPIPMTGCWIQFISIQSADQAIAACQSGFDEATLIWDGSSWTLAGPLAGYASYRQYFAQVLPEEAFTTLPADMWGVLKIRSENDIWISNYSSDRLLHWNGATWKHIPLAYRGWVVAIEFNSKGNGLLLTHAGELFRLTPIASN